MATTKESKVTAAKVGLVPAIYKHILDPGLDYLESFVDDVSPAIVENVPILKSISGAFKAGFAIKERIFVKKLILMLSGIKDIPIDKRNEWIDKMEKEGDYVDFGEKLLMAIETIDDYTKAAWLGRALKEYISGSIDRKTFSKINKAIQVFFADNARELEAFYLEGRPLDEDAIHNALASGLVKSDIYVMDGEFGSLSCTRNDLGGFFVRKIAFS